MPWTMPEPESWLGQLIGGALGAYNISQQAQQTKSDLQTQAAQRQDIASNIAARTASMQADKLSGAVQRANLMESGFTYDPSTDTLTRAAQTPLPQPPPNSTWDQKVQFYSKVMEQNYDNPAVYDAAKDQVTIAQAAGPKEAAEALTRVKIPNVQANTANLKNQFANAMKLLNAKQAAAMQENAARIQGELERQGMSGDQAMARAQYSASQAMLRDVTNNDARAQLSLYSDQWKAADAAYGQEWQDYRENQMLGERAAAAGVPYDPAAYGPYPQFQAPAQQAQPQYIMMPGQNTVMMMPMPGGSQQQQSSTGGGAPAVPGGWTPTTRTINGKLTYGVQNAAGDFSPATTPQAIQSVRSALGSQVQQSVQRGTQRQPVRAVSAGQPLANPLTTGPYALKPDQVSRYQAYLQLYNSQHRTFGFDDTPGGAADTWAREMVGAKKQPSAPGLTQRIGSFFQSTQHPMNIGVPSGPSAQAQAQAKIKQYRGAPYYMTDKQIQKNYPDLWRTAHGVLQPLTAPTYSI